MTNWTTTLSPRTRTVLNTVILLALGGAGGASAVAMTRPTIEMAPAAPTAIASLSQHRGIVTIKGTIADVYGDRFIVGDPSGRTMVDAGRAAAGGLHSGSPITVQGRFADGQLHASFLVEPDGTVEHVGPPHGRHGPGGPGHGPAFDGPPPPPGGPDAPPPAGCAPDRGVPAPAAPAPAH